MRVQMESNDGVREASSIAQNFRCAGIVLSSLPSFLGAIYHRLAKWRRFAATRKEKMHSRAVRRAIMIARFFRKESKAADPRKLLATSSSDRV